MSDAFVMLLVGGAYTVIVFVLGAVFEQWRHDGQKVEQDERGQAIIATMAREHGNTRAWSIPEDEQ